MNKISIETCDLVNTLKKQDNLTKKQWIKILNFLIENNCTFASCDNGNYNIRLDYLDLLSDLNKRVPFDLIFAHSNLILDQFHESFLIGLIHKSYFAEIKLCNFNDFDFNFIISYIIKDYKKEIVKEGVLHIKTLLLLEPIILSQVENIIEKNLIKNLVQLGVHSVINN